MRTTLFTLAATLASFALPHSGRAESPPCAAVLASPSGAATRTHPRLPWKPVASSGAIRFGAELRCDEGCTARLDDGSAVRLEPHAVVVFVEPSFVRLRPEEAAARAGRVEVHAGGIWVDRPAGAPRPLVVADERGGMVAVENGDARFVVTPDR